MKNLKNKVRKAADIAKDCPKNLQNICFEIILKYLLRLKEETNGGVKNQRIYISIILFILFIIFSLLLFIFKDKIFYQDALNSPNDCWRFLWVLPFAFLGLSFRSWRLRNEKDPPLPAYIYYTVNLLIACIVIFAILHLIFSPLNWQYYPISAAVTFLLGCEPWKIRHWFPKLNL